MMTYMSSCLAFFTVAISGDRKTIKQEAGFWQDRVARTGHLYVHSASSQCIALGEKNRRIIILNLI